MEPRKSGRGEALQGAACAHSLLGHVHVRGLEGVQSACAKITRQIVCSALEDIAIIMSTPRYSIPAVLWLSFWAEVHYNRRAGAEQ